VREAQRLRYKVFVEEMGARIATREAGIDHDHFDQFCDHLVVRDQHSLQVVGTYRLLSPGNAVRIGAFYADSAAHRLSCRARSRSRARASTRCSFPGPPPPNNSRVT
jgi:putative hemolysin